MGVVESPLNKYQKETSVCFSLIPDVSLYTIRKDGPVSLLENCKMVALAELEVPEGFKPDKPYDFSSVVENPRCEPAK